MPLGIRPPGLYTRACPRGSRLPQESGMTTAPNWAIAPAGPSPRKNGQRYRPHLDLNQRPRDLYPPLDEPTMRGRGGPSAGCAPRAVTPDPIARRAEVESLLELPPAGRPG